MAIRFSKTAVVGRRIDPTGLSWESFTILATSYRWRRTTNCPEFRRHRFHLLDSDESLRRAAHLSNRRFAYRLPRSDSFDS